MEASLWRYLHQRQTSRISLCLSSPITRSTTRDRHLNKPGHHHPSKHLNNSHSHNSNKHPSNSNNSNHHLRCQAVWRKCIISQ